MSPARLRADAARTDAAFAALERQALATLRAIQYRAAIEASERVLRVSPAPAHVCAECLAAPIRGRA